MNMYLVDYWMPFPMSEYGGLQCVIARNEDECYRLIMEEVGPFTREKYPQCEMLIKEAVEQAAVYKLADDQLPRIAKEFTT